MMSPLDVYSYVSQRNLPPKVLKTFFTKTKNFKAIFYTHTFSVLVYATLQSSIQLFLNLMKLCYIMHTHSENFPFSQRIYHKTKTFDTKQMVKIQKLLEYYS